MAQVLNEPRNEWYQRQWHKPIPRRAESRQYLDATYTARGGSFAVPAGYSRALLNQRNYPVGSIRYGYSISAGETTYGGFTPDIVGGVQIARFTVQETGTNNVIIRFGDGNQQVPGVNTLAMTIEGFGALSAVWSAGSTRYQVTSASFWTFLSDRRVWVRSSASTACRREGDPPWLIR